MNPIVRDVMIETVRQARELSRIVEAVRMQAFVDNFERAFWPERSRRGCREEWSWEPAQSLITKVVRET